MPQLLAALLVAASSILHGCFGIGIPADADVIRPFAPVGRWSGHWGVDLRSQPGTPIAAIGSGVVTFAGTVARNRAVSIDHGGGVVTSYSYLDDIDVSRGDRIRRGEAVGRSGLHDGAGAFHLSVRVNGRYIDPLSLGTCARVPGPGLYLAIRPIYAVTRARDPWRHIRSAPQRSSGDGRSRLHPTGSRFGPSHAGW